MGIFLSSLFLQVGLPVQHHGDGRPVALRACRHGHEEFLAVGGDIHSPLPSGSENNCF